MRHKPGQTELTTDNHRRTAVVRDACTVLAVALTASLFSVGLMNQAHAQVNANGLDPTFGGDGIVTTNFFNNPNAQFDSSDIASDVVIQPDGKIVVAGSVIGMRFIGDFAVARYPVDATSSAPRLFSLTLPRWYVYGAYIIPPILGGTSSTGTVELCSPAPSDVMITLADNLAAAHVPASVTIPAGSLRSTFTIKTTPVTDLEIGVLTANLGAAAKSVPLRVRPIKLSSLTLSPNPVEGSHSVTGIMTLEHTAFAGGVTVQLSSSNTAAAYPTLSQITIAPGTKRRSFTIRTNDVPSARRVVIRASANGITQGALLTVQ